MGGHMKKDKVINSLLMAVKDEMDYSKIFSKTELKKINQIRVYKSTRELHYEKELSNL